VDGIETVARVGTLVHVPGGATHHQCSPSTTRAWIGKAPTESN
jgi:hypothetical protein